MSFLSWNAICYILALFDEKTVPCEHRKILTKRIMIYDASFCTCRYEMRLVVDFESILANVFYDPAVHALIGPEDTFLISFNLGSCKKVVFIWPPSRVSLHINGDQRLKLLWSTTGIPFLEIVSSHVPTKTNLIRKPFIIGADVVTQNRYTARLLQPWTLESCIFLSDLRKRPGLKKAGWLSDEGAVLKSGGRGFNSCSDHLARVVPR